MVLFPCFYSIVVTHPNRNFSIAFPLFHAYLRDNGPTSEPQFFHCVSIPSISAILLLFYLTPTSEPQCFHCFSIVLLHFFIIVPRFFHCFSIANGLTSKPQFSPLLFHSFTRHHFPLHSSIPSIFFKVFPPVLLNRPIVYAINLSFHFINFSSVLPWCYSISPSLPLYYLSVSNAYPNAPATIPTVAPYKRFCSCLPWFYFRASTP